jgi:hypothetical protein
VAHQPTADSAWRIELARQLIRFYVPHDSIEAAILSGSPPKGLSDQYSDLDIIIFWSEIDREFIEAVPLRDLSCELKYSRPLGDYHLESYYFGPLKVDVGHGTLSKWEEEVDDVVVRSEPDESKIGAIAGFITSLPLHGDEVIARLKTRMESYPDELAEKIVRGHRRFFVPGYLMNQAYGRGDMLAYCDGLCQMVKNLLSIVAGLNRVYMSTEEPRWLSYYLSRMPIKPERMEERIQDVLAFDGEGSVDALEGLIVDVLALIHEHMPDINGDYEERWRSMTVRGCPEMPDLEVA